MDLAVLKKCRPEIESKDITTSKQVALTHLLHTAQAGHIRSVDSVLEPMVDTDHQGKILS